MTDIIKTCYDTIGKLNIPNAEKERLFAMPAEDGFTEALKTDLMEYIDADLKASDDKLPSIGE